MSAGPPGNSGRQIVVITTLLTQARDNPGAGRRTGRQAALASVTFKLSQLIRAEPDGKYH